MRRDGYNTNSFTGDDDGDVDSFSGRGSLLYTPSDSVDFLLTVEGKVSRPNTSRSPVRETSIAVAPDRTVKDIRRQTRKRYSAEYQ